MIRRSLRVAAIAAVLFCALAVRPAAADQVVQTFGFTVPDGVPPVINASQFDPSLGTLTGITLGATPNPSFPYTDAGLLGEVAEFTVGDSTTTLTVGARFGVGNLRWDVSYSRTETLSEPEQHDFLENLTPWYAQSQAVPTQVWGQFVGTGTFALDLEYTPYASWSTATGSGIGMIVDQGTWSGTLQVTYTYTPAAVPEPAGCAMGLIAAAWGAWVWRRR
jgi:hypothetical protein